MEQKRLIVLQKFDIISMNKGVWASSLWGWCSMVVLYQRQQNIVPTESVLRKMPPHLTQTDFVLRGVVVKDDNYIVIQGWMRTQLNLKGNELIAYALIYGFSQDNESAYTGSVGYIADWMGTSKQTVHNVLKSLCGKGFLHKEETVHNGIKFCSYTTTLLPVKKFDEGWSKNLTGGGQKIRPNNIDNNTNKDIYIDVPEEIKPAFMEWAKMRKGIKKPITSRQTVTRALKKLDGLAKTPEQKIELIEIATDKCWLSFYPKKDYGAVSGKPEPPKYKRLEPDEEVDAVQMPQEIRERLRGIF